MKQVFIKLPGKNILFKKSSFFIIRLLAVLFSCTYCEENTSFSVSQSKKIKDDIERLSNKNIGLLINNGAEYTAEQFVNLTFIHGKDANEMFISFDSDCSTGTWEPLETNKDMELRKLNQQSSVYVKYKFLNEKETDCVGDSIIHDNIPPELEFINPPASWIAQRSVNMGIQATDSGSGVKLVECDRQGEGQFEACGQNIAYSSLVEDQNYSLVVRVQDKAGNFSQPKQINWKSDQTKPTVLISSGPDKLTNKTEASFSFRSQDSGSGVERAECRLDGGAFSICESPKVYTTGLSDGNHIFSVRVIDEVGNVSETQTYDWFINTAGPLINFSLRPDATVYIGQTAQIQFGVTDTSGTGVKSVECLYNGSHHSCSADTLISLSATDTRKNSFQVITFDNAGNRGSETLNWQTKVESVSKQTVHNALEKEPIDVLFVVDNSSSMIEERKNLAEKISGFIEEIDSLDWQIVATTTDVDNDREHDKGRFTDFDDSADTVTRILNSDMEVDKAQSLFGNRIQSFPNGSFNERGITAVHQAIERYKDDKKNNRTTTHTEFFREGAHLAVVLLSDEDEDSSYTADQFLTFFGQSFIDKTLAWHSIIINSSIEIGSECRRGSSHAEQYETLSKKTNGVVGNICDSDYTNQLSNIGKSLKDMQKEITLECEPLDDDLDGNIDMEVKFKAPKSDSYQTYSGTYTIQADKKKVIFDEYLDSGDYQFNFKCAK